MEKPLLDSTPRRIRLQATLTLWVVVVVEAVPRGRFLQQDRVGEACLHCTSRSMHAPRHC